MGWAALAAHPTGCNRSVRPRAARTLSAALTPRPPKSASAARAPAQQGRQRSRQLEGSPQTTSDIDSRALQQSGTRPGAAGHEIYKPRQINYRMPWERET